jgi:hypothetical protein
VLEGYQRAQCELSWLAGWLAGFVCIKAVPWFRCVALSVLLRLVRLAISRHRLD